MDPLLLGGLSFVVLILLIFSGLHVGVALLILGVAGLIVTRGLKIAFDSLQFVPFDSVTNYGFAVVPLFILMGEFLSASGLTAMFFEAAQAWFGRLKGGLGMTVCVLGGMLGSVCGSAFAGAAMLTRVAFPEMIKHKHDPGASAGLIAAVSPLVLIIPPSVFLALYAILVRISVGKVLIAGFFPGFLAVGVYMLVVYLFAWRRPRQWPTVEHRYTWKERVWAIRLVTPIIIALLFMLGGIYAGVFTPSEAGAGGAFITLIFLLVMQRKNSGVLIKESVWNAAGLTSMIFLATIGAMVYGRFMASTGAADEIVGAIASLPVSRYVIFGLVILLYLVLGCFVDELTAMLITLPVTAPLMRTLGFDLVWFGVIVVFLICIGMLTPPFGLIVFLVKSLVGEQVELWAIFKWSMPFAGAMLLVVILITVWPQVALFLPSRMFG